MPLFGISSSRFQVYGLEREMRGFSESWLLFLESAIPLSSSPPPKGVGKGMKTPKKDHKGTPDPLSLEVLNASAPSPSEFALRKKGAYSPGFASSNDAEGTTAVPVSTAEPGRMMNWRQSAGLHGCHWRRKLLLNSI